MNNNKLTKSIILAGIFAVSLGLGFVGYRFINKEKSNPTESPVANGSIPTTNGSGNTNPPRKADNSRDLAREEKNKESNMKDDSSLDHSQVQTQDSQEPKVSISATKPKLNGDSYSFVVTAINMPQNESPSFELYNKSVKLQSSSNGVFSNVPGVAGGKYIVWLVGSKSGRLTSTTIRGCNLPRTEADNKSVATDSVKQETAKPEKPKKMLITKDEFQSRLLNANDMTLKMARKASDKQSILSKNFNVAVIDMNPEENKKPSDVEGVREKIHFGIWKSATVVDISYDEATGQVTRVVVKPVY